MSFIARLERARAILAQQARLSVRALGRELEIGGEELDELIEELVDVQQVARREGSVLIWAGPPAPTGTRSSIGEPAAARPADQTEARKVVTIIFADLAGSTALHERLDPESVRLFMESYYRAMRGAVAAQGGTVVKLLGDGVMAAFGVPRVAEDDALRAVRAGLAMQSAFRDLARDELAAVGDIGLRVAINTGEVVVSADNTDVVGDPVNVAARLQQEAHDGDVVIGEPTRRLVAALVTLEPLGSVALKGRSEAVRAYRVVSLERPQGAAAAAFVGRDEELARLTAVYERAVATPAGALAVLLGSPGLGKSRLIEEFARRHGDAATVVSAHCDAAGGATFAPLAVALRQLLQIDDAADAAALRAASEAALPDDGERARIAGGVAALLGGSPAAPEETFFVVRRFLAGLAQSKPVVLVIDDLHWAEPLLLDLVEHLVQWSSGVPLCLLVGARPELRDVRSSLVTRGGVVSDVVTLGGLDAGAAMRLAANVIGAADLPAAVAAKVLATSEGNPLFVGELVRMLVQEGALTKEGERWTTGAGLATLEMPPTIHALLAARIERLRPDERGVLERAAVVGRHFSRGAVAALLGRNGTELDARLEALRRSELIEPDTGWFLGEPALRFHHVLIRDAAYRRLLKGTRAELHGRLADWIEAQVKDAAEHDETIGWHLEQAHQHLHELGPLDAKGKHLGERAAQRLSAAGRRALARDDVPLAASLLGRAIDRLERDDPSRAELALDWCEALLSAGDVAAATNAIAELARCATIADTDLEGAAPSAPVESDRRLLMQQAPAERRPPGASRLAAWHTCFAGQLTVLTAPQELQATADAVANAAEQLAQLGDAAGEAKAHSVHAQALARLGKVGASEAALDKALAAARKAGDRRRANAVLAGAPLAALWGPSPVTRASGRCLDVVRVLRITQGAPAVEAVALSCQGVLEALRGRTDAARRMIASSRKMVEELGIAHRLFEADVFAGRIDLLEGDAAAAERHLRGAYDGLRDLGLGIDAARAGSLLARAQLAQGKVGEAETSSQESEALAGDDLQAAIAWRGVRAEALAQRGEHAAAVELAQAAVAIAAATDALLDHADARLALAAALRAAGRGGEAAAEQRRAIELWEAKGATLLAERVQRDDPRRAETAEASLAQPRGDRGALGGRGPTPQRRVQANAAIAAVAAGDAALARSDLAAVPQLFAEAYEEVDHPTGSAYGKREALASVERLLRSRNARYRVEPLAVLGDRLMLGRRCINASAAGQERFDVGEYENETVMIMEVDAHGRYRRLEVFATDRLGDAVARIYERYAALAPAGPERQRRAMTARAIAAMQVPPDVESGAAVFAPDIELVDARSLGTWSARGAEAVLRHWGSLTAVADDIALRDRDVLALRPEALLVARTHSGTERLGGGVYERPFLMLLTTATDGRVARIEWFDADRAAEALARFDELTAGPPPRAGRRRIRANAATAVIARMEAAFAARDLDAVDALLGEAMENIDHPTEATYGRKGQIESSRRMMRTPGLAFHLEALATLGDDLCLLRRRVTASGTGGGAFDVGAYEMDHVGILELDAVGRCRSFETFAPDHLGDAVARLYERYAERLPEGSARTSAAAVAQATQFLGQAAAIDPNRLAAILAPEMEGIDHRQLSTWSLRGAAAYLEHLRALRLVGDNIAFRQTDILALEPAANLCRVMHSGTERLGGGVHERLFLSLFVYDDDGRLTRAEWFDTDREAEALLRFDALVAPQEPARPVQRRVPENAATASRARLYAAFAAQDAAAAMAELSKSLEFIDHPVGAVYDRARAIAGMHALWRGRDARTHSEPLAALGDSVCLFRRFLTAQGTGGGRFDVGAYEREDLALYEIDEHRHGRRIEVFAVDHLSDAVVRLFERHAALLPEGPQRRRAAATARSIARMYHGLVDRDRLASPFSPDVEWVDHRVVGVGTLRGDAAVLAAVVAFLDLTRDVRWRADDVLACSADGVLTRSTNLGTDRAGGGTFERTIHSLIRFDADGLVARWETFDVDREAEALARFDELARDSGAAQAMRSEKPDRVRRPSATTAGRAVAEAWPLRRVRANTATALVARFEVAFAATDSAAIDALWSDRLEVVNHPTGASYGRAGHLESLQRLRRARDAHLHVTPLATFGETLALTRRAVGASATVGGGFDVGDWERVEIVLFETGGDGRCQRIEIFAPNQLNDAIVRGYARYAELLPAGPARQRATATSAALAAVLAPSPDIDRWTAAFAPDAELMDRRTLGFGSLRGVTTAEEFNRALFDLEHFSVRADEVLASGSEGILLHTTTLGTSRASGGDFERPMVQLWEFDAAGLIGRISRFDPDRAAEALARFDALGGDAAAEPPAAAAADFANAASATVGPVIDTLTAHDWQRFEQLFVEDFHLSDRRRVVQLELDRGQYIAFTRELADGRTARGESTVIATRGERLALTHSTFVFADGDVGPSEIAFLLIQEVDERGRISAYVRFDVEDLDAAYAALDARWEAGEGAAHAAHVGLMAAFGRAVASRDWEPVVARCAPGFIEHDRRGLAVLGTTRGADAWTQNFRTLVDLAPDTVYRVDHIRSAARGLWSIGTWCGTREGGHYEIPVNAVLELDEHDRLARADIYEPDQLDAARARFAELKQPAPPQPFANAASTTVARVIACMVAHDWQGLDRLHAEGFHVSERRRTVQLELDRHQALAFTRELTEGRTVRGAYDLLATRGERLALVRMTIELADGDVGPSEIATLMVHEVDEHGRIAAHVRFDPDNLDAAYAALDARWEAGGAATHRVASQWIGDYTRCFAARDWSAMAAIMAPDLVAQSHRLVSWETLQGPAGFVSTMQAQMELAPDTQARRDHLRTCEGGVLLAYAWHGTRDGGAFENLLVAAVETGADGRARRVDVWEPEQLDRAQARFAEIAASRASESPSGPSDSSALRPKPTTATLGMERSWTLFDAGDWDACRAACAPGFTWEDRRPLFRLSGDIELMIASARERMASGARHQRRSIVGAAGDRVVINSVLWAGGPADGRFEVEFLVVQECDATGLGVAVIFFDPGEARAAQREAWARWAAIDPASAAVTRALDAVIDAANERDLARYRALFADDLIVEDHRQAGAERIEGADTYAEMVAGLWQFAPDSRIDAGWFWPAVAPHGAVTMTRRLGALADEFLWLYTVADGRITRIEVFALDDIDAATARLAELHPDPLRIPPNAATRAVDRHLALAAAGDWDGVQALHAPGLTFDDRRKGLRTTVGRDAYLAGLRWGTPGVQMTHTLLATAGDRLELRRNRFTRTRDDVLLFEIETTVVTEIDADGRLAAIVLFDPDDHAAAHAELVERYAASGADGTPTAALEVWRAWNAHDLERLRALLPDDFYLDDRRRTGVGRLDGADAYVASLAALWELSGDLRIETLYFDRTAPRGRVYVTRWSGTNAEGGELDAVYVCLGLARGGRVVGLEIFELEDFAAARARFDELCAPGD